MRLVVLVLESQVYRIGTPSTSRSLGGVGGGMPGENLHRAPRAGSVMSKYLKMMPN